jgi:hypothetical protein
VNNCKLCGKTPVIADVGGNNQYYEISCSCGESPVVGAHNEKEAITTWNILNKKR